MAFKPPKIEVQAQPLEERMINDIAEMGFEDSVKGLAERLRRVQDGMNGMERPTDSRQGERYGVASKRIEDSLALLEKIRFEQIEGGTTTMA